MQLADATATNGTRRPTNGFNFYTPKYKLLYGVIKDMRFTYPSKMVKRQRSGECSTGSQRI